MMKLKVTLPHPSPWPSQVFKVTLHSQVILYLTVIQSLRLVSTACWKSWPHFFVCLWPNALRSSHGLDSYKTRGVSVVRVSVFIYNPWFLLTLNKPCVNRNPACASPRELASGADSLLRRRCCFNRQVSAAEHPGGAGINHHAENEWFMEG